MVIKTFLRIHFMKEFVRYVTHDELGNCLGMYAAVYRERVVDGRRVPNPAYGTLEMLDGLFILMNKN